MNSTAAWRNSQAATYTMYIIGKTINKQNNNYTKNCKIIIHFKVVTVFKHTLVCLSDDDTDSSHTRGRKGSERNVTRLNKCF